MSNFGIYASPERELVFDINDFDENIEEMMAGIGDQLDSKRKARIQKNLDKAHHRDSLQALARLTTMVDGRARILSQPPLLVAVEEMAGAEETEATYQQLRVLLRSYRRTLRWDRRHLLEQSQMVQLLRGVLCRAEHPRPRRSERSHHNRTHHRPDRHLAAEDGSTTERVER